MTLLRDLGVCQCSKLAVCTTFGVDDETLWKANACRVTFKS